MAREREIVARQANGAEQRIRARNRRLGPRIDQCGSIWVNSRIGDTSAIPEPWSWVVTVVADETCAVRN